MPGYVLEGTACQVWAANTGGVPTLWRGYNPQTGDHFYTIDAAEMNNATSNGYNFEGPSCWVDFPFGNAQELLRAYNKSNGDHFYTTSKSELDNAVLHGGYTREPSDIWVPTVGTINQPLVALQRLYNKSTGDHFYTISDSEIAVATGSGPGGGGPPPPMVYTFCVEDVATGSVLQYQITGSSLDDAKKKLQSMLNSPDEFIISGPCPMKPPHPHSPHPHSGIVQIQRGWRWCRKCQALSFVQGTTLGACPAGGMHDHAGSGDYTLALNSPAAPGQHAWKWCRKCQVLSFGGSSALGACAAGGVHDHAGSGDYALLLNSPAAPGQHAWKWCRKCEVLAFAGGNAVGTCAAGGVHDHAGSGDYTLGHG